MTPGAPGRVVLLGGTFDPIHCGHLAVADQVRALLGADEVWLIPSGTPPHRGSTAAPAGARAAMVRAAAAGRPGLRVLDLELRRPGPSYTSTTIAELAREHPGVELWFLLGADAARDIRAWHRLGDLLEVARFVVVNRDGAPELTPSAAAALGFDPARTRVVRVDSPPISATDIRRRAAAGEPLEGLVPPEVEAIIVARGLYGARGGAVADNRTA
ncbi:MAG TPA: nicotinate-nucleotide adenylyltransferase [Candidatus Dormibacteraeota bacterium]|nr:nicotinate-nucleotide adenylyltransferase [Candidatus Dormibacteraeota bacterium]